MNVFDRLLLITQRAKNFGFAWPTVNMAIDQVISEAHEVMEAITKDQSKERIAEEVGDLLQASLELCLFLKLDPDMVLNNSIDKFTIRLDLLEKIAKEQGYADLHSLPVELIHSLWHQVKMSLHL